MTPPSTGLEGQHRLALPKVLPSLYPSRGSFPGPKTPCSTSATASAQAHLEHSPLSASSQASVWVGETCFLNPRTRKNNKIVLKKSSSLPYSLPFNTVPGKFYTPAFQISSSACRGMPFQAFAAPQNPESHLSRKS